MIHDNHLVYYDDANQTDLFVKLDQYRLNQDRTRRIAITGYLHCMKYHRAVNLLDYIFRTVHLKQLKRNGDKNTPVRYSSTGYHMRNKAKNYNKIVDS